MSEPPVGCSSMSGITSWEKWNAPILTIRIGFEE